MRINVYGEEITNKVELVKKAVDQKLFYGVRFYLKSHSDLHHSDTDNDESAVTFWVPWTKKEGSSLLFISRMFEEASNLLEEEYRMNKEKEIIR